MFGNSLLARMLSVPSTPVNAEIQSGYSASIALQTSENTEMQTATTVISVIIMAILGGLVGLIEARISATLMTRKWKNRDSKEATIDVATIITALVGAVAGGFAGSQGLGISVIYLLIEVNWVPAIGLAIWASVVTVRQAIKLSDLASNWLSARLDGR
jgi:hypothetical protein